MSDQGSLLVSDPDRLLAPHRRRPHDSTQMIAATAASLSTPGTADLPLQRQGRSSTQQGPNGSTKIYMTAWGRPPSQHGCRLHVQGNARMHLRSAERSDTM